MNSKHQLRSSLRKKYMTIAVLAAIIYVFFLSSKLWMPNADNASNYTEIGTVLQIGNSDNKVTLINWEYSEAQEAMSVEMDLASTIEPKFAAVDKSGSRIPVNLRLAESGTYVLELSSVPADFRAISLRVTTGKSTVRLYTNESKVSRVSALSFYSTLDEYLEARIGRNQKQLEAEIADTQKQIADLNSQIEQYQQQIDQTTSRMPYLTRQQRSDAEASIKEWNQKISDCQNKISDLNETIQELKQEREGQGERESIVSETDTLDSE